MTTDPTTEHELSDIKCTQCYYLLAIDPDKPDAPYYCPTCG